MQNIISATFQIDCSNMIERLVINLSYMHYNGKMACGLGSQSTLHLTFNTELPSFFH